MKEPNRKHHPAIKGCKGCTWCRPNRKNIWLTVAERDRLRLYRNLEWVHVAPHEKIMALYGEIDRLRGDLAKARRKLDAKEPAR